MDPSQRQEAILRSLADNGPQSTVDLAERLETSEVTVRRDLTSLAAKGLLRRTRGGAVPVPLSTAEFVFQRARHTANLNAKRAIARAIAERIEPRQTILLDTGTTTLEVARCLPVSADLRVLTSSLAIASLLHTREDIELVLLGGIVRKGSPDLHGLITERNLRDFRVDLAVIGADAACRDGLFTTDQRIALVSRAMIESGASVLLAADAGKFAARAFVRFAEWQQIRTVVTDASLPARRRKWLRRKVSDLVFAKAPAEEAAHV